MIASLEGVLAAKFTDHIVVNVQGVGYRIWVSLETLCKLPEQDSRVFLDVVTQVRNDAIHLFGFHSLPEKELFLHLIAVSGIGPKIALNILSRIPQDELRSAIHSRDVTRLKAIPGVGKKTAERIVVELAEKIGKCRSIPLEPLRAPSSDRIMEDVISALMNLGYKRGSVEKRAREVVQALGDRPSVEEAIRQILQSVDRSG